MTILSRLVLVSLLLGGLCLSAAAQGPPAGEGDARAIKAVISMQISAFRHNDAEAAFSHAAPNIRRQFGTAKRFMKMVRTAYAPVYRPKRVVFAKLHIIDGKGIQQVNLIEPDGAEYVALCEMFRRPGGGWQIAGVALLKGRPRDI